MIRCEARASAASESRARSAPAKRRARARVGRRRDVFGRRRAQDAGPRQLCSVREPVEHHDRDAVSAAGYAYAYYLAVDANHNRNIEPAGIKRLLTVTGVDPNDPLKVANQIDPHLSSPRTHEIVAGVDRELAGNVALSASYTWRRYDNVMWPLTGLPVLGVTSANYVPDGTINATRPAGRPLSATYYALPASQAPAGGGLITENAPVITARSTGSKSRRPGGCRTTRATEQARYRGGAGSPLSGDE